MGRKPKKDIMKPEVVPIGSKPKVIGGMAHGFKTELQTKKAPPLARADLLKKGFCK